jgi:hypothetical protein
VLRTWLAEGSATTSFVDEVNTVISESNGVTPPIDGWSPRRPCSPTCVHLFSDSPRTLSSRAFSLISPKALQTPRRCNRRSTGIRGRKNEFDVGSTVRRDGRAFGQVQRTIALTGD